MGGYAYTSSTVSLVAAKIYLIPSTWSISEQNEIYGNKSNENLFQ